jgi:ribonuclease D
MPVITDTESLSAFCTKLAHSPYITVDTEFMREKTYWPQLCLVQLADQEEAKAVDVLADGIDLTPMLELMADTNVLKVFHAARQDLEIFYRMMNKLPEPIFDTQVAAMVCGFGDSAGYETLVRKLTNETVDKSSRFTDWGQRPLSDRQISYALSDVTHLRDVYESLNEMLSNNGRHAWLEEEIATLTDAGKYTTHPEDAWQRVKSRAPKPRFLAILKEIAAWRETEAQSKDIPRNRILRDEALVEIAHHAPSTVEQLARTRGMGQRMAEGPAGQKLLKAISAGQAIPDKELPRPPRHKPLPKGIGPVTDLLKVLLKMKSEQHDVAQRLIATSDDLEKISAYGEKAEVHALQGWRREVFGNDALSLRAGNLALVVHDQSVEVVEFVED